MLRTGRDIIVIGGSAGGPQAAMAILEQLSADPPAAVFVALHRNSTSDNDLGLTELLGSRAGLPVEKARDELPVGFGRVYVAAGDDHLILENGVMRLQKSPRENLFRPCINVLFKSAAMTYGRRVIGVLLSGVAGNDGAAGLWQIQQRGGIAIVQDPEDAQYPGMLEAALAEVAIGYVLPATRIGPMLNDLVASGAADATAAAPRILVVEDESVVATNLQHSLVEMGYDVIDWVPTGEAAIELAGLERPDLILMDIHLAGALNGIESARAIWEKLQIPIVFCTAHADLATLTAVQTTENYGYVVKPFQSAAVRAAIELALARREKELR